MATAANPGVSSAGRRPVNGLMLCRNLDEAEIETMLSDRLVDGCILMERSCPACVTPLLKQSDEAPMMDDDENSISLKRGKGRDTTKSGLEKALTPIDGVPFCVSCQAHVVTSADEIEKVEDNRQSLKDLVLSALALEDEPLFFCDGTGTPKALLREMVDNEEGQGYEVIQPDQWREDPSVRSHVSKYSSPKVTSTKSSKSVRSTVTQRNRTKRLAFTFADAGDVEILRTKSSVSMTPLADRSQKTVPVGNKVTSNSAQPAGPTEEQRQDENGDKAVEKDAKASNQEEASTVDDKRHEEQTGKDEDDKQEESEQKQGPKDIVETPNLVDATPASREAVAAGLAEIDVKKESSVDHEELTADFLTFVESEDEWLSYEEKKAIAAKALGVKMMQGYSLLEKQCPHCSMPLAELKGIIDCVVCPALKKKTEKVKHQHDRTERERVRVMLETQLLQQRKLAHDKKNRLFEKTRHLNEVSAHLRHEAIARSSEGMKKDSDATSINKDSDSVETKSINKVVTCQTGASTFVESPRIDAKSLSELESPNEVSSKASNSKVSSEPTAKNTKTSSETTTSSNSEKQLSPKKEEDASTRVDSNSMPFSMSVDETNSKAAKEISSESNKSSSSKIPSGANSLKAKASSAGKLSRNSMKGKESLIGKGEPKPARYTPPTAGRMNDRCRPVRPVMGIVKITPQPRNHAASVSLGSKNKSAAMGFKSAKPQLEDDGKPEVSNVSDANSPAQASLEDSPAVEQNTGAHDEADESVDDSTRVSSMHSDSTISTKSRTFRKNLPVYHRARAEERSVECIAEHDVLLASEQVSKDNTEARDAKPAVVHQSCGSTASNPGQASEKSLVSAESGSTSKAFFIQRSTEQQQFSKDESPEKEMPDSNEKEQPDDKSSSSARSQRSRPINGASEPISAQEEDEKDPTAENVTIISHQSQVKHCNSIPSPSVKSQGTSTKDEVVECETGRVRSHVSSTNDEVFECERVQESETRPRLETSAHSIQSQKAADDKNSDEAVKEVADDYIESASTKSHRSRGSQISTLSRQSAESVDEVDEVSTRSRRSRQSFESAVEGEEVSTRSRQLVGSAVGMDEVAEVDENKTVNSMSRSHASWSANKSETSVKSKTSSKGGAAKKAERGEKAMSDETQGSTSDWIAKTEGDSNETSHSTSKKPDPEDNLHREDPAGAITPQQSEDSGEWSRKTDHVKEDPAEVITSQPHDDSSSTRSHSSSESKELGSEKEAKIGRVEIDANDTAGHIGESASPNLEYTEESGLKTDCEDSPIQPSRSSSTMETASVMSRKKHWESLRTESRAFLARRCLVGWTMLSETCKGAECGGVQLVKKRKVKECVICGGTGSGTDGVYALLLHDEAEDSTIATEDIGPNTWKQLPIVAAESAPSNVDSEEDTRSNEAVADEPFQPTAESDSGDAESVESIPHGTKNEIEKLEETSRGGLEGGLEDISLVKTAFPATSSTIMSIRSNDVSTYSRESITKLHQNFESKRSAVSQEIAMKMTQGWTLLNLTCPQCVMPLMLDDTGHNEVCLLCGIVGNAAGDQSVRTAATDFSSAKSKGTTGGLRTDDEDSTKSLSNVPTNKKQEAQKVDENSKGSSSRHSDIRDRIMRSSMVLRRGSPRGDPPAVQGHTVRRRNQLEVEDSRSAWQPRPPSPPKETDLPPEYDPFLFTIHAPNVSHVKAQGPTPTATDGRPRFDPEMSDRSIQEKDKQKYASDDPVVIDVEGFEDKKEGQNLDGKNDRIMQTRQVRTEQDAEEQEEANEAKFEVKAVPRNITVSEKRKVVDVIDTVTSNTPQLQIDSSGGPSPSAESAACRLPSPGMTEASLPRMSPGSQHSRSISRSRSASVPRSVTGASPGSVGITPGSSHANTSGSSPGSSNVSTGMSPNHSQQTRPWGSANRKLSAARHYKRYPHVPNQELKRQLSAPSPNQDVKNQLSFGSSSSSIYSRRRVTPECPAGRPRSARTLTRSPIGKSRSSPTAKHSAVRSSQSFNRASPSESPILQMSPSQRNQNAKAQLRPSNSFVSSSSSASSSVVLKVPVDKQKSSASSAESHDFMLCDDRLEDVDIESVFSGNTRSVTSEAIDQLLARIEDTQVELVAAEKEEDGIHKQERLKELLSRLSIAAAAIQELDNGSQYT